MLAIATVGAAFLAPAASVQSTKRGELALARPMVRSSSKPRRLLVRSDGDGAWSPAGTTEHSVMTRPDRRKLEVAVASMHTESWDAPYREWRSLAFDKVFVDTLGGAGE